MAEPQRMAYLLFTLLLAIPEANQPPLPTVNATSAAFHADLRPRKIGFPLCGPVPASQNRPQQMVNCSGQPSEHHERIADGRTFDNWSAILAFSLMGLAAVRFADGDTEHDKDVQRFRHWLDRHQSAAAVTDGHGVIIAANSLFEGVFPDWWHSFPSKTDLPSLLKAGCEDDDVLGRMTQTVHADVPPSAATFTLGYRDLESLEVTFSPQFDVQGKTSYGLWTFRDNSDDYRLQQHHEHSEKMQAITRLAGGMAHEFNNLLTAILGNLELIRTDPDRLVREVTSHIESAEVAALRASQLIHELRMFASRDVPAQTSQSLSPIVRKVRRILAGAAPDQVSVTHRFLSDEEPFAVVNAQRLEDALLKIGWNAVESIGGNTGTVHMSVDSSHVPDELPAVTISITDTGEELSDSAVEKTFEPFPESGDSQESSGLGMAIAYGLIEDMNGTVKVTRASHIGNEFTVSLPQSEQPDEGAAESDSGLTQAPQRLSIAILDSESSVRKVARGMLRLLGHEAATFECGLRFIKAVEDGRKFDLVMMDNAMPGMSGRRTYEQFRRLEADAPVVICSGRSIDLPLFCPTVERPPDAFVSKPFSIADLSAMVAPYA